MTETVDAVVIGAGPNGLVAANLMADAGWDVLVLEAQPEPGGAVRSGELTVPGFVHDRFSAFYPLAAVSPAIAGLHLEDQGLSWRRADIALAHVFEDGEAAVISSDVDVTAASVERFGAGDGAAWRELAGEWDRLGPSLMQALMQPFPPVRPALALLGRLRRPSAVADFVRRALLPVRRLTAEHFSGPGASMLLAGNTLHTDLGPESALGGFYGWLLAMLAQSVGFPVPEGGSGQLTRAMVRRLERSGGSLRCAAAVERVLVHSGRATGVMLASGQVVKARRAVVADVIATHLYSDLVGAAHLPERFWRRLERFELDHGTFKMDWALDGPIPWKDEQARRAGTLHLGGDMGHLTGFAADLSAGRLPRQPFVVFGQMNVGDPTRSPAGTETAWAYTHVPNTRTRPGAVQWDDRARQAMVERLEAEVERRAPGFGDRIIGRYSASPEDLEAGNANLVGGAINQGTSQLHQQLVFRPVLGRAGPTTPVAGLYLGSSSAHPGGGVHGACGAHAARAALRSARHTSRKRASNTDMAQKARKPAATDHKTAGP